jgi:hypothetical protein
MLRAIKIAKRLYIANSQLQKAIERVRFLVKNKNMNYAIAINRAAIEFDVSTKEISNYFNPPKKDIKWRKPNFNNEVDEYFLNKATRIFLGNNGYNFKDKGELINFLQNGELKSLPEIKLYPIENLTIDRRDFRKELEDESYASSYNELQNKLNKDIKIELEAPILISFPESNYLYSGNRRVNLAINNNIEIKFWIVKASDIKPKQRTLL